MPVSTASRVTQIHPSAPGVLYETRVTQEPAPHTRPEEAKHLQMLPPEHLQGGLSNTTPPEARSAGPGPSTHVDGGLIAGQDTAQPLQVTAALAHAETQLLQLLLFLLQGTEFLIYCSLCDRG